ncbi:MAG: hypothetical protein A2V93_06995 [Ignavibacteria bacterium RBG_16_34_14]|nr:MAG: hypothetical protein A2V93_06995 [Ignavibacteria bacterium RBG_16_34_14]
MGKGLLIIVLGIAGILSLLKIGISANTSKEVDTSVDFFKKTHTRLIANSGIEIYLEKLRRDKNLTGYSGEKSLFGGEYEVNISGPDSALQIVSNSEFYGTTHRSFVLAKRTPVKMPTINSALYINATGLGLNLNGNMDIDGNDHNTDGSPGPNPAVPGVGLDSPADSAYFKNNIKPKISRDILGAGGAPSIRAVADTTNWLTITEALIFAADITIPSGTYDTPGLYGTPSEPKITFVNGDVHLTGGFQGDGIMIVNGNLEMDGNSTFRGIVLVYKNSSIETNFSGNGGIFGGTILAGTNVNIQATGNSSFYYSSQALANAQAKLKSSRFEIVEWWE